MKNKLIILSITELLLLPAVALAADPDNWVVGVINNVIDMVVLPILGGLVIIMFIWAGVLFLTSEGDTTKITKAKHTAIYAIVGIIVAILAFSATGIIQGILGF